MARVTVMAVMAVMTVVMAVVMAGAARYQAPRVTLIPRRACSFQPYNKRLTCGCGGQGGSHSLQLDMQLFIRDQGQEVGTGIGNLNMALSLYCIPRYRDYSTAKIYVLEC